MDGGGGKYENRNANPKLRVPSASTCRFDLNQQSLHHEQIRPCKS